MQEFDKYIGILLDNRYKIQKVIGTGGMSLVFKAEDTVMHRTVAVKMLKEEKRTDPAYVKSFINESRAVAMLSHENIVHIYDVSVKDDFQYIVMEYIEGITLKTYLKRKGGVLDLRETLNITEQILRALQHAHEKGVVHRDIKPQNIMLVQNGMIKVADFGIAKLPGTDTLTKSEKAIGTVHYISPEQADGRETDAKSDLYSVGVLMYELSCGQLPFTGDTPIAVAMKHIHEPPVPPRNIRPGLPQGLEQIILRAMEKDTALRYQSAEAMLKHIKALKENEKVRFRTPIEIAAMSDKNKKGKKKKSKNGEKSKEKKNVRIIVTGKTFMPTILGILSAFLIVAIIIGIMLFNKLFDMMNNTDSKEAVVNDYIGQIYSEDLKEKMEREGYRITYKEVTAEEGTLINQIVKQSPNGGQTVKYIPNEKPIDITLYVYEGADSVKMPDFVMKEYNSVVTEYANEYKFKRENVNHDTVPSGYIIRTSPESGKDVATGSTVTLYVSIGPEIKTVLMESLIGIESSAARQWIINNNLTLGYITFEESEYEYGCVVSQSVGVNVNVPEGTAVNLVISSGPPQSVDTSEDTDGETDVFDEEETQTEDSTETVEQEAET